MFRRNSTLWKAPISIDIARQEELDKRRRISRLRSQLRMLLPTLKFLQFRLKIFQRTVLSLYKDIINQV